MTKSSTFLALAVAAAILPAQTLDPRTADTYTAILDNILGLNFTTAERAEHRRHLEDYARAGDRKALQNLRKAVQDYAVLRDQPADLVAVVHRMTRTDYLLGYHTAAREGSAEARWVLDRYYQRNPRLAEGRADSLPLTRDMVEAELGLKHWHAREIHRQPAPAPSAPVIEQAVQAAVRDYPRLTREQQITLARQPGEIARIRYAWPRASAIDQLITRSELGARLTPQEQGTLQQVLAGFQNQLNGMVRQHQNAMFQSAMQSFQQNTDTIMGRGTVWNPATNRWEQQGGIVTEFNGTVRVP